jgi:hypothetical protein
LTSSALKYGSILRPNLTRELLYCKVSEKGAISVYGLQRMPVTLYVEQWERLLAYAEEIKEFMKAHDNELKRKEK